MSAINGNQPGSSSGSSTSSTTAGNGFGALSANDFMQMLIQELKTQDPTQPMKNEDLLNQLSTMRNLQSNIELGNAVEAITTNQQLATATGFIGKAIQGTDDNKNPVSGVVDRAFLQSGTAYIGVGSAALPLSNILNVAAAT